MEYYDSISKKEFHQYYLDKSNKLLQNPTILELLESKRNENVQEEKILTEPVMKKPSLPRKSISNKNLPVVDINDYEGNNNKKLKITPTIRNIPIGSKVIIIIKIYSC